MIRSLGRWLVAAAGSVLLGLALIGAALYWHFLRSGPQPAPDGHELVLFDVNRLAGVAPLMVDDPGPLTRHLRSPAGSSETSRRELGLEWPRTVFSLSHVALPFPPDDPLYGYEPGALGNHVQLGNIEIRGENGVLSVPTWALMRQRSNPFHAYLIERIDGFVEAAAR